jgi:hypothetical protein
VARGQGLEGACFFGEGKILFHTKNDQKPARPSMASA